MKSPFPGMDPYLEARWSDVHPTLIAFIKEAIQPQLPPSLRARSEERVLLEDIEASQSLAAYRSDIAVVEVGRRGPHQRAVDSGSAATIEPITVKFYSPPEVDRFVQIIDTSAGNRVVTAIEVLSPANKAPGRVNQDYLRKLDDYERAQVNLVEIDLLREPGRGRLRVSNSDLPPQRRAPYMVCVGNAHNLGQWQVYPIPLRTSLPQIPVPLRSTDAPIILQLQPLIDRVYVAGGHDDIDYSKPPNPPLSPEDAAWTQLRLQSNARL